MDLTPQLPRSLALIDDDVEYSEYLTQHLQALGVAVQRFGDIPDLLAHEQAFGFGFYIVDLMLPGGDGVDLIAALRQNSRAGILVVSGRAAPDVFAKVIDGGADMYLAKPVSFDQVVVAVRGVHRRVSQPAPNGWLLDVKGSRLLTPDGETVALSETDLAVMTCFLEAGGLTVTREALRRRLGYPATAEAENLLSATVYRLRRRVERATPLTVPLHTQARVGYVFRATLKAV